MRRQVSLSAAGVAHGDACVARLPDQPSQLPLTMEDKERLVSDVGRTHAGGVNQTDIQHDLIDRKELVAARLRPPQVSSQKQGLRGATRLASDDVEPAGGGNDARSLREASLEVGEHRPE